MLYELPKSRQIAANFHGGQGCPLYAFASTGSVVDGFDTAIFHAVRYAESSKDQKELLSLWCEAGPSPSPEELDTISEFWHRTAKDSRGRPLRIRPNGKLKLWKTRPHDFRLPVKYGLRECFYLTPSNIHEWVPAL